MRHAWIAAVLLILSAAPRAWAGVVQLRNGDRVSGKFQQLLDGKIVFKTNNFGTLSIPVAQIKSFTSEKPVVAILKSGKSASGILSVESGTMQLVTTSGKVNLQTGNVTAVYPAKVYNANRPKSRHMPWQDWNGQGALGYVLQESSQNSKSLSVNFDSSRIEPTLPGMPPRRATHFSFNMAFATVTQLGVTTKANTLTSVLRQDFFIGGNARNYLFAQGEWDHIQPQEISLRQTYGGGMGRNLIMRPNFAFGIQGGMTYVRTAFATAPLRNEMEALAGEKVALTVLKNLSIKNEFDVYPSLTKTGNYRFNSLTSLDAPISKRLTFNISVNEQYLSAPVPGTQANVLILSTGLGVKF